VSLWIQYLVLVALRDVVVAFVVMPPLGAIPLRGSGILGALPLRRDSYRGRRVDLVVAFLVQMLPSWIFVVLH